MTLSYDIVGDGSDVVLLHGALSTRRVFGYQLIGLSRECRVLAPDLPGFGSSPFSPDTEWLGQAVDDVVGLLARLKVTEPVIVGWSLGGLVARLVAERIPYRALVLVNVSSGGLPEDVRQGMRKRIAGDFPRFARGLIRQFTASGVSNDTEEWLFDMAISTPISVHLASLVETAEPLQRPLPGNTVVVTGAYDQIVPHGLGEEAGARHVRFSGSGHSPFIEEVGKFNETILDLVRR